MFAKLVGEGFERPNAEGDLPLDVNYAKVGEWLVSREFETIEFITRMLVMLSIRVEIK